MNPTDSYHRARRWAFWFTLGTSIIVLVMGKYLVTDFFIALLLWVLFLSFDYIYRVGPTLNAFAIAWWRAHRALAWQHHMMAQVQQQADYRGRTLDAREASAFQAIERHYNQ